MTWRTRAAIAQNIGPATAEKHLIDAYKEVFKQGQATELVLADLAVHCRFYLVEMRGISAEEANYVNGLRAAFARILQHVGLPESGLDELEEAARAEAASHEGF